MARNNAEALRKMDMAAPFADVIEVRLDVMQEFDVAEIVQAAPRPIIVTYRSRKEGGSGSADSETQSGYLLEAIEAGADFVDVEYGLPPELRQRIFQGRSGSALIISAHLLDGTPARQRLEEVLRKMADTGADVVKIITLAMTPEDNLRVLGLIPLAKELGVKIIAFCMGPLGRISRISTLLTGGYLTFASLEEGQESASGQMPVGEMKDMLERLSIGIKTRGKNERDQTTILH